MVKVPYGVEVNEYGWWSCMHKTEVLRERTNSNGAVIQGFQCQTCGHWRATKKDRSIHCPEFDTGIAIRFNNAYESYRFQKAESERREFSRRKEQEDREWKAAYSAWLLTTAWKARRDRVMNRAGWLCECCLKARAEHVHHTTYACCKVVDGVMLDATPMWLLKAICKSCHDGFKGSKRVSDGGDEDEWWV